MAGCTIDFLLPKKKSSMAVQFFKVILNEFTRCPLGITTVQSEELYYPNFSSKRDPPAGCKPIDEVLGLQGLLA